MQLMFEVDKDGKSWRSGAVVQQKMLKQWFFRITDFAKVCCLSFPYLQYDQALHDGLGELNWPSAVLDIQRAWIGRSEGFEIDFTLPVEGNFMPFCLILYRTWSLSECLLRVPRLCWEPRLLRCRPYIHWLAPLYQVVWRVPEFIVDLQMHAVLILRNLSNKCNNSATIEATRLVSLYQ